MDFRKKLTTTAIIAIIHYAAKDIFKDLEILQKMYFPERLLDFLRAISYEYGIMIGRCTALQFKCGIFITLLALFLSFCVYFTIVWTASYIANR